jgi:hypothetical protein
MSLQYNNDTPSQGDIFSGVSKTGIFLNKTKREAKVYCYAFLHVLKSDTCIKHEKNFFFFFKVSCVLAGGAADTLKCPG